MGKQKILVVRFSSIGDIVLTTIVLRCLKQQLPHAEIHYLTKRQYADMLAPNPYVDKIYSLDHRLSEVIPALRHERYDIILDLHRNLRSFAISFALLRKTIRVKKHSLRKWWFIKTKLPLLPSTHIVDRYLAVAHSLGVKNDHQGLDFFLAESDHVAATTFPPNFQNGYIAVVVGSKHQTKQMPLPMLVSLCKDIRKPVVLLGGDVDRDKAAAIAQQVGGNIFNACGIYSINQSASIIAGSWGVIAPDTGLMHIAAALRQNIISVWGNTVPAFGMYPYLPRDYDGESVIIENPTLRCRPCSKLGFARCPKKHFRCMLDLSTASMAAIANQWDGNTSQNP